MKKRRDSLKKGKPPVSLLAEYPPAKDSTAREVPNAGLVKLEVFNPSGVFEVTELHAPRLLDLSGKTIGELGDGLWEDRRIFPVIRELLRKRFHDVKFIPFTEFPYGYEIDDNEVAAMVKERGCEGVIVASAG